jgi:hypothetical protein
MTDEPSFPTGVEFLPQRYEAAVPIENLVPWDGNPRRHDKAKIRESIGTNGFAGVVIVQEATSRIIAGHGRTEDVLDAGGETVPVLWLDVDDDTAARLLVALNATEDAASNDPADLAAFLGQLAVSPTGLLGTTYSDADLDLLIVDELTREIGDDGPTDPMEEWVGMPEFEQENLGSKYRTTIHFRNEDDADEFARKVLGEQTRKRSAWWPEHDGFEGSTVAQAWIQDEETTSP